jgi:transcriptional regulator with XRE-family HTH domain
MATPFGRELRKFRIDHDITLQKMAKKMDVSISYISGVEAGSIKLQSSFLRDLNRHYRLTENEIANFNVAFENTVSNLDFTLQKVTADQRNIVFSLKRSLPDLDEEQCRQILEIINRGKNK